MPKFNITGGVTISIHKTIEAPTKAAALKKAADLSLPNLCYGCSNAGAADEDQWELSGELDGEPSDLKAEKA